MSLHDLGVLLYLHNKLQQVDKEAEVSTTIRIDLLKRYHMKELHSYTVLYWVEVESNPHWKEIAQYF